ncbi:unnamed protein product [Rhizophagus irregularis]|nr:unnamed protein product [Rhizophagus irregularis]CAB5342782.1 unnamed protein product [Rhizophagus irregularis]
MGVLKDAKDLIYKRLTSELNTFYTNSTLSRDLESTPLFSPVTDANHPVYLIIHSVVPQSLVDLIHSKIFAHILHCYGRHEMDPLTVFYSCLETTHGVVGKTCWYSHKENQNAAR